MTRDREAGVVRSREARPRARLAGWLAGTLLLAACGRGQEQADLLIRGGHLIDGTGAPAVEADVAVRDGRIAAVGRLDTWRATRVIDAGGLVVTPGFVDLHSHADVILLGDRGLQEKLLAARLLQGVTTVVVGNCGLGTAPAGDRAAPVIAALNGWMTPDGVVAGALDTAGYLDRLATQGVAINVGTLVPHGPLRIGAMGLRSGEPTAEELDAMRRALRAGLDAGALGLSAGLIYPPGMYSSTDELVQLAHVVAERERLFAAHVRGSSETLLAATGELITIARESGARVHHSHLEAVGESFWPAAREALRLEDAARADGLDVTHDVFPYTRAATMMSAIFPPWSLEGGAGELLERLRDPPTRERIRVEIETRAPEWPPWLPGGWPHNLVGAVGWDGIVVASVRAGGPAQLVGRSLDEIAREQGRTPFEIVVELMLSEQGQVGQQVKEISGTETRSDVLFSILSHPRAIVVSDAEDYGRGVPHPAHAGAFVRALRLTRDEGLLDLPEAVHRMTGSPAARIGLDDGRGVIREGAAADLVLLDADRVTDRATWSEPRRSAEGVELVLLNGHVVVEQGRYVGGLHGRVLRGSRSDTGDDQR